ncbi:Phage tail length tape-measure protein [Enterococcus mundtii 1A]|uniref:tape measure protein n=1 Tax=Enterococcus mundtii TaxID=53346 RepID=UPI00230466E3|nr:tape measure protein [Enterococcus mundtii]MDA9428125.1 Phage tail length tape-measure protein [Enterococcus mundtii 1A]
MESYSVEAIISAIDDGFTKSMKQMQDSMGGLNDNTKKTNTSILDIAKGVGVFKLVDSAIGMVKNSTDGAIKRFDTLNQYPVVMRALGYSTEEVDKSMNKLTDGIDGLPTSLDEIVSSTQQLAISTGSLDKGTDTAIALNNAMLASGSSSADAARGIEQYRQMLARGEVDMQSWRSVQDTMPVAMDKVAKSFEDRGVTSVNELYDALKAGEITFDEFNDRLIELNEGVDGFAELAKKNSAGIQTSFDNIKTAVVKGLANVIRAIDDGLQNAGLGSIAENFDKIKDAVNDAFNAIVAITPSVITVISNLVKILQVLSPLIISVTAAFVAYKTALGIVSLVTSLSKAMTVLKVAFAVGNDVKLLSFALGNMANASKLAAAGQAILNTVMSLNLFAVVIAAVVGLVAAFIYFWNTSEAFRDFWIGLWESIQEIVHSSVEGIKNIWSGISEWFKQAWNGTTEWFSDLWNSIKDISDKAWTTIQKAPENAANFVREKWSELTSFFTDLWSDITQSASEAWENIKQSTLNIVDGMISSINKQWDNLKNTASSIWKAIADQIKSALDFVLKYIGPFVSNFSKVFSNIIDAVKSIFAEVKNIILNAFEIIKALIAAPLLFIINLITGDFQQMKDDLDMIWGTLVESVQNIWLSIKNIFTVYIGTIINSALLLWDGFKQSVINIWTEVSNQANIIWNQVKSFFANLWITIKDNAVQMWTGLKQSIVQTWEDTKNSAIEIWTNLKTWFFETIDTIVQTIIDSWTGLKQGTIDLFNNTVEGSKNIWNAFKEWISNLVTQTKDGVVQGWENLKQGTINIFNLMVNGVQEIWDRLVNAVNDTVGKVTGLFDTLKEINLWEAGKAIMDSFLEGLQNAWKAVQDFVGGIGDWIRENKGPIQYDRKLLIPAGNAIMEGLNKGLTSGFDEVQSTVESMASIITDTFDNSPEIDLASNLQKANSSISTQVEHNVNMGGSTKPAIFNVNLGKQSFRHFVDDIAQAMGEGAEINLEF